jgi:SAM-dependent methyltransferase
VSPTPGVLGDPREARRVGGERWNSNLHAFEILLRAVPDGVHRGLDVGCGEGETARRLRNRVQSVIGLDPDAASIDEAVSRGDDIEYRLGALEGSNLPEASFDVVSAVAMLHHTDHKEGLNHLARLVRPGGLLLVVGLARSRSLSDFLRDTRDAVALRRHSLVKGVWHTPSPKIWTFPLTYAQARAASLEVLPDAGYGRVPYFRYGLTWHAPIADHR